MKIIFVIKALNKIKGGAERVLCQVASGLALRGHEIQVISFDVDGGEPSYPLDSSIEYKCLGKTDPYHPTKFFEAMVRIFHLRREIKKQSPDIVIGFMHSAYVLSTVSVVGLKIPVVASEHIVPKHYQGKWIDFFLLALAVRLSRYMTVVLPEIIHMYPWFLRSRIVCIPNPISFRYEEYKRQKRDQKKEFIILNIGRFEPQKDHKTLISAFSLLADKFPQWKLKLIGQGNLEKGIRDQIIRKNLEDRVEFLSVTDDISSEYKKADLFVVSSVYESFCLVVAESLAHSLPVVGFSDCFGVNVLVQNGKNGILVSGMNRVVSLAEGMERLMKDDVLRDQLGSAGPESVRAYDLDLVLDRWDSLLRSVISSA